VHVGTDHLLTLRSAFSLRGITRRHIVECRDRRVRRLIAHAYETVPYYRRLLQRSGIDPSDVGTAADLRNIPVSTKDNLRAVPVADMLQRGADPRRLKSSTTSGFSGEPFTVRYTPLEQCAAGLFGWRAMRLLGLRPTDRLATVLHLRHCGEAHRSALKRRVPYRELYVDCCQSDEGIFRILRRYRPTYLGGYAGALTHLAGAITEADRRHIRPRAIVTSAEVLTDAMREQIRWGFGAPVHNVYYTQEIRLIAWECRESGELHVSDDGVVLEVLKNGRPAAPGEEGEVVATNLSFFTMPIIRCRLGDIATQGAETCPCGLPFPTLRKVIGREIDYFPLPDGRLLHPNQIVGTMLDTADWVRRYQLVQERKDRIVLRAVPLGHPSPEKALRLEHTVSSMLGPAVEFRVVLVSSIERGPGGKFRVSRSLVRSRDGAAPPG